MAFFEPIIGGMVQGALGAVNNYYSAQREQDARYQNYLLNEKTAENADARTRALYNDFYSPSALMQQYKGAGLSPSLMFGGTPGQGGTAGAQGAGVNQPSTFQPISVIEGAQAALMAAQTENIKADTKNKEAENILLGLDKEAKEISNEYNGIISQLKTTEAQIIGAFFETNGEADQSLFEVARKCNSVDEFINKVREKSNEEQKKLFSTEIAGKVLRSMYKEAHTMDNDIKILNLTKETADTNKRILEENEKLAKWQNELVEAMKNAGFANMNAEAAISFLKSQIQTNELNETQKAAWNRLINKMEDGTMKDIVIVLAMILNQAASNWHMPSFNNYTTNNNIGIQ